MQYSVVYLTLADRPSALAMGRTLVEERIVACANVIDGMTSIYQWQGAIEEANETVLLLKTTSDLVDQVTRRIVEMHSYECPCVVALPIENGNPAYLQWISEETSPAS